MHATFTMYPLERRMRRPPGTLSRPGTISRLCDVASQHAVPLQQQLGSGVLNCRHAACPLLDATLTRKCLQSKRLGCMLARRTTLRPARCIPAPHVQANGPPKQRKRASGGEDDRHDPLLLCQCSLAGDHSARLHAERPSFLRRLAPHRLWLGIVLVLEPPPARIHAGPASHRGWRLSGVAAARGYGAFCYWARQSSGRAEQSHAARPAIPTGGSLPASHPASKGARQKISPDMYERFPGTPLIRVTNLIVRALNEESAARAPYLALPVGLHGRAA